MSIFDTITLAALANDFTISEDGNVTTLEHPSYETLIRIHWDGNTDPTNPYDTHGDISYAYHNCAGDSSSCGVRTNQSGDVIGRIDPHYPTSLIVVHWILETPAYHAAVTNPNFDGGA